MAQLIVRNLPDDVKARLKRRAAQHGRSLEAEVRAILAQAPEAGPDAGLTLGAGTNLAQKLAQHKVGDADWRALEANINDLRRAWRVRDVDLDQ